MTETLQLTTLRGRTVLLTGATDGIGLQTALLLARSGVALMLHGRDGARLAAVREAVLAIPGAIAPLAVRADFSSLAAVRSMAREVREQVPRLDALVNNAGVGSGKQGQPRQLSADGFELRLQVNYLAPYVLTSELLPLLCGDERGPAAVVNVASVAQESISFEDPQLEGSYSGRYAYGQSKLALIMWTFDLAARLDPRQVTVNALHPGSLLDTKIVRETFGRSLGLPESGAEAIAAALVQGLHGTTGKYFDVMTEAQAHAQAYDEGARAKLQALTATWIELTRR